MLLYQYMLWGCDKLTHAIKYIWHFTIKIVACHFPPCSVKLVRSSLIKSNSLGFLGVNICILCNGQLYLFVWFPAKTVRNVWLPETYVSSASLSCTHTSHKQCLVAERAVWQCYYLNTRVWLTIETLQCAVHQLIWTTYVSSRFWVHLSRTHLSWSHIPTNILNMSHHAVDSPENHRHSHSDRMSLCVCSSCKEPMHVFSSTCARLWWNVLYLSSSQQLKCPDYRT